MLFKHHKLGYLVFAFILLLALSACVRPLQPSEEETEATAVVESEEPADTTEGEAGEEVTGAEEETTTEEVADSEATVEAAAAEATEEAMAMEATEEAMAMEATEEAAAMEATEEAVAVEATEEAAAAEVTEEAATAEATEEAATAEATEEAATAEATEETATAEATEEAVTAEATEEESQEQNRTATGEIIHTVAPGENLYRIGLQYGMSWVPIARSNNITNPNQIVVGQDIIIPGTADQPPSNGDTETAPSPTATPIPPDSSSFTNYVVQPGDTLSSISRKFGVSPQEIAEANGLVNPNLIYVGQVLKIPTSTPETPPQVTHTVQSGETVYSISLIYGVHWLSIAQENNISPPYVIYAGQSLTIPGG